MYTRVMSPRGLTTASVIQAACEIADADGIELVTVSAVAGRLGVRPPSLYSHVGGTEALRSGVTLQALTELADLVTEQITGRSGHAALAGLASAHREYATRHPGRFAACRRPVVDAESHDLSPARRHADLNAAVLRGYDVPEADRVHATRLVAAALTGFLVLESTGAFARSAPPPPESWDRTVDALHAVLVSWARP